MTTISLDGEMAFLYGLLFIFLLYVMIKYKEEFDSDNLIRYLIYLTNKVILFWGAFTFVLAFMMVLTNYSSTKIEEFFKGVFFILFYYVFINYGIYYGLKLIHWAIKFFKDNDLYAISYLDKAGVRKK